MSQLPPMLPALSDEEASPEARAVFDDIRATRGSDFVNDFWRVLAHDPVLLARTWHDVKQVMAPGALDPLTKELIYVAVSVTNGCTYCINSHASAARAKGMTDAMLMELVGVVGMANETNRLVTALQVPVDEALMPRHARTEEAQPEEKAAVKTTKSAKTGRTAKKAASAEAKAATAPKTAPKKTTAAKTDRSPGTTANGGDEPAKPRRSTRTKKAAGTAATGNGGARERTRTTTRRKGRSSDA